MTLTEMQCVYFFKQFQIDGSYLIKIGMTSHRSPEKRLSSLKTYSPYGCELVGFIITTDALKLEKELHKRFEQSRLNGEWFFIDENKCYTLIKHYNKPQENIIKKMFAEFLSQELDKPDSVFEFILKDERFSAKEKIEEIYKIDKKFNRTKIAEQIGLSKRMVFKYLKDIK